MKLAFILCNVHEHQHAKVFPSEVIQGGKMDWILSESSSSKLQMERMGVRAGSGTGELTKTFIKVEDLKCITF